LLSLGETEGSDTVDIDSNATGFGVESSFFVHFTNATAKTTAIARRAAPATDAMIVIMVAFENTPLSSSSSSSASFHWLVTLTYSDDSGLEW